MCNEAIYKKGVIVFSSDLDPVHFGKLSVSIVFTLDIYLWLQQNLKSLREIYQQYSW